MGTTLNAVTFMGKNYSTMQNVVQNEENFTLKQMFDITAQTIHNDEEIYCLDKVVYLRSLVFKAQGLRIFGFCVMSRQSSSTS